MPLQALKTGGMAKVLAEGFANINNIEEDLILFFGPDGLGKEVLPNNNDMGSEYNDEDYTVSFVDEPAYENDSGEDQNIEWCHIHLEEFPDRFASTFVGEIPIDAPGYGGILSNGGTITIKNIQLHIDDGVPR